MFLLSHVQRKENVHRFTFYGVFFLKKNKNNDDILSFLSEKHFLFMIRPKSEINCELCHVMSGAEFTLVEQTKIKVLKCERLKQQRRKKPKSLSRVFVSPSDRQCPLEGAPSPRQLLLFAELH